MLQANNTKLINDYVRGVKIIFSHNIKNNVVLITGAAGGIGRELCSKFYELNYSVVGLDKNGVGLKKMISDFGFDTKRFLSLEIDITIPQMVNEAINTIQDNFGEIAVVINNAGGPTSNTFMKTSREQWLNDIDLNLNSVFYVLSCILPRMVKMKQGTIVNICSVNGISIYGHPAYSAAKAGLINLTKFLAVEYGKYNIRTNAICPGTVKTDAWSSRMERNPQIWEQLQSFYSIDRLSEPADVAEIVAFLASSTARTVNGSIIVADGGLTAGIQMVAESFMQEEF